jgi:phosphoribosylaminoimidazole carboxylase PurE protein
MKDLLFIIGSESDRDAIQSGLELMKEKDLTGDLAVYSAHRNLSELEKFLKESGPDYRVIIAAAGLSAALPGIVASLCPQPVIGVPLISGPLGGMDALLSILQLPKGVPVATMGIGKQGVLNAVHLAERILRV